MSELNSSDYLMFVILHGRFTRVMGANNILIKMYMGTTNWQSAVEFAMNGFGGIPSILHEINKF